MSVTVSSPSRLHFGLMSVGNQVEREFGGIGTMIQSPRTVITAKWANEFEVIDLSPDAQTADRISKTRRIVEQWWQSYGDLLPPQHEANDAQQICVSLTIEIACPRHNGLGSGTQLALTIAIALHQLFDLPMPKPDELAVALGRAGRSAIGTWGCFEGGFLVDRGKLPNQQVAPIDLRLDFPTNWPIALIFNSDAPESLDSPQVPNRTVADEPFPEISLSHSEIASKKSSAGLHGEDEIAAFETLTPTTNLQYQEMKALVKDEIVPALAEVDYARFGDAIQVFGRRSGEYFHAIQGGTFANDRIAQTIDLIASKGVPAVGQTSWGPCVFAMGENMQQLRRATDAVAERFGTTCQIEFTIADNAGVQIHSNSTLN